MKRVYDFLINDLRLTKDDSIAIGLSGGPDSMSLAYILYDISLSIGFRIICCHVNHNLRIESTKEADMVKKWCDEHNITFEIMKLQEYGENKYSSEADTRKLRYAFFDSIVKKYNCKYLMTAHHGDDLIETILMRITRGSTLKGYAGFQKVTDVGLYKIVRPLIYITKDETENFCKLNNIPYVIDQSNFKDKYTRNRYRSIVLPFLKNEDANVHEKFLNFSNTLLEYDEFLNKQVDKVYRKVYTDKCLNILKFLNLDYLIQKKIIYNILEEIYFDDINIINDNHVNLIFKIINSNKKNTFIYLPNNVKIIREYNFLKFCDCFKTCDKYKIKLSDHLELPNGKSIDKIEDTLENGNNICRINSNDVKLPLYVRTREDGDKIDLYGMIGHKKVKDIFIDFKIPVDLRDSWPIVVDSNDNIIWIPGIKKSKFMMKKCEKYDMIYKYY